MPDFGSALLELSGEFAPLIPTPQRPAFVRLLYHLGAFLEDTEYRLQAAEIKIRALEQQPAATPMAVAAKTATATTATPAAAAAAASIAAPTAPASAAASPERAAPARAEPPRGRGVVVDGAASSRAARRRARSPDSTAAAAAAARKRPRGPALPTVRDALEEDRALRARQRAGGAGGAGSAGGRAGQRPCAKCLLEWRARRMRARGVICDKAFATWRARGECIHYMHMDEPVPERTFAQQHAGAAPDFVGTPTESPPELARA